MLNARSSSMLALYLLIPVLIFSQNVVVQGKVIGINDDAISGVNAFCKKTNQHSVTDATGNFRFILNGGDSISIEFAHLSYQTKKIRILTRVDTFVIIKLTLKEEEIETIEIIAGRERDRNLNETTISASMIKSIPSLGGEKDVLKALHYLPGIQPGSEGTSGLNIRGSETDQNLILFDNIPIRAVSHLFGYMSVFDADMIESVTLIKGGFPASYGGRLASVIEINLKDGTALKTSGTVSLGLISSKIFLEIPIKKNAHLLFSVRKTYIDLLARAYTTLNSEKDGGTYLGFYDSNLKYVWNISPKNSLKFNLYFSNDKVEFAQNIRIPEAKISQNYFYKTTVPAGGVSYTHKKSELNRFTTYFNLNNSSNTLEYNTVSTTMTNEKNAMRFSTGNTVSDYTLGFKYITENEKSSLQLGNENTIHKYAPFNVIYEQDLTEFESKKSTYPYENSFFADYQLKFGRFETQVGSRLNLYSNQRISYLNLEPRIATNITIKPKTELKASYTVMHQYSHILYNISLGLPTELWLPVSENNRPIRAEQYSIGIFSKHISNFSEVSIEAFYKTMKNLTDFSDNVPAVLNENYLSDYIVNEGKGTAYGIECYSSYTLQNLSATIAYTLSKSERQFDKINNGKPFPFKFDRRHNLTSTFKYQIKKNITFSGIWTYMTGAAVTLPVARYYIPYAIEDNNAVLTVYSERNQYRMPAYHRMDLAIDFVKIKAKGKRTWTLSLYNVYNRKNAYFLTIRPDYIYNSTTELFEQTEPKLKQVSLFPIIPSVSYSFEF